MKKNRVLITDDVHDCMRPGLEEMGYSVDYRPEITLEEVKNIACQYIGLIINSKIRVDRKMLEGAPSLRFIGRLGSGLDIIDLPAASEHGVAVLSVPEGNANAVAEHAVGMLLALANNLVRADREVRQMEWRREANRGFELEGRTIGIVGYGHTGSSFAEKLKGFGVQIRVFDKYKSGFAKDSDYVKEVTWDELIRDSEIISFHVPLTEETRHMVNRDLISTLRTGTIIINTSRGKVVDTEALVEGLEMGKIRGACLDVYENERPETFSEKERSVYFRLYTMDRVVLTPHVAGWTMESKEKICRYLLNKIRGIGF